ncbi:hypothetical protein [Spongiimicrobium sp. 3-5]|uniref:hypothetical protein n=1 Tax=Spongiimicrobium sp. 3-5 TaxID=3332596 RepID=UPI00397FE92B
MKNLVLGLFLLLGYCGLSQVQLSNYKYIIVPKTFDGFKEENKYHTNSLVKFLFTKKGFNTVYEDALPEDLVHDRCLGLVAELVDDSSMFTTKVVLALKDCNAVVVFTSQEGRSKLKEYRPSYSQAIRNAFSSFETLNYSYVPKQPKSNVPITVSYKNDVKTLPKETKPELAVKTTKTSTMVKQEATPEEQRFKSVEPMPSSIKKEVVEAVAETQAPKVAVTSEPVSVKAASDILYAQELPNGYQLVDSTPKIRFKIFKSSLPDYYLAETEDKKGVVYKKDGKWLFEYYVNDNLTIEELNIKF